jgi:Uma2 family endonuclease
MTASQTRTILYPDSDRQPMADNTLQFSWIVLLKENLDCWFEAHPEVFVAGDLLWYPVEGTNKISAAPDALVAFGRPKGYRGSYKQWEEGNIAPQVVFEVLSPSNTAAEMAQKLRFYQRYGVTEYYLYDPYDNQLTGYQRQGSELIEIPSVNDWTSPLLKMRFVVTPETWEIYQPDGQRFLTTIERQQKIEQVSHQAEQDRQKAERLAAQLRALGIEPEL